MTTSLMCIQLLFKAKWQSDCVAVNFGVKWHRDYENPFTLNFFELLLIKNSAICVIIRRTLKLTFQVNGG